MASLTLHADSAEFTTGIAYEGSRARSEWRLVLGVSLPRKETLKLSTGETLEEMQMHLSFRLGKEDEVEFLRTREAGFEKAIGGLYYFAARPDDFGDIPGAIIFEAYVGASEIEGLYDFAQTGRFPRKIDVTIEGLDYDWQPDGSGKKWDNASRPMLPLTAISFSIPISDSDHETEGGSEKATQIVPANSDVSRQLTKLTRYMQWAVYLFAALVVILLWRGAT